MLHCYLSFRSHMPHTFLDGVDSEVSLVHPEDARCFINLDETHHKFSNESDKGGSRAIRYACSFITRSGDRIIKNGRHTTGVYGTNAFGEALPPLYILDSKAKYKANYKIDPRVCIGLPEVVGKYGLSEEYLQSLRRLYLGSVEQEGKACG